MRPSGGCDKIDDLHGHEAEERHITDKNVVFAFQVCTMNCKEFKCLMFKSFNLLQLPIPREGIELDYSRWMQNLIGILQIDVKYFTFKKGIIYYDFCFLSYF